MRLWHEQLLSSLPKQQLLSQHRECVALLGKGWGRKHSTVNYVFKHPKEDLQQYHAKVVAILINDHGVNIANKWRHAYKDYVIDMDTKVYNEHNDTYKLACVINILAKHRHHGIIGWSNSNLYSQIMKLNFKLNPMKFYKCVSYLDNDLKKTLDRLGLTIADVRSFFS